MILTFPPVPSSVAIQRLPANPSRRNFRWSAIPASVLRATAARRVASHARSMGEPCKVARANVNVTPNSPTFAWSVIHEQASWPFDSQGIDFLSADVACEDW
jgi:hypothetical protein